MVTDSQTPIAELARFASLLVAEVEKVIVGKRDVIEKAILTLLCEGHLLLEDIPGVGKTTLAKSLAQAMGGEFRRIQFTPDLLPADITGASIFNQRTSEFEFRPGPIFGNVILADEVNRATPKTQSALLEAMEERQTSADGVSRTLPNPFFVIATQNSLDLTGTYPLPEAQLDRFFGRLSLGYPSKESEMRILEAQQSRNPIGDCQQVVDPEKFVQLQNWVREVHVSEAIRSYIVDIVAATRTSSQITTGASPRGSLHLMRAAQARAAMNGNNHVGPSDVKSVAPMVLAHRIQTRSDAKTHGLSAEQVIEHVIQGVPAPPVSK